MSKTRITVDCIDQRLLITNDPLLASGGQNESEIVFTFCPLWQGYGKTAVFYRTPDEVYNVEIVDDRCTIPAEVLTEKGEIFFGVFGDNGSATRTSEILRYTVVQGALLPGVRPADPTPDIYAQIMGRLGAIEAAVNRQHRFRVYGEIAGTPTGTARGSGCATIIIDSSGLARIEFQIVVTAAGTNTSDYTFGLRIANLQAGAPDLPAMSAVFGGDLLYYTAEGALDMTLMGSAGMPGILSDNSGWNFGRQHSLDTPDSVGVWPDSVFKAGTRIRGVCYAQIA